MVLTDTAGSQDRQVRTTPVDPASTRGSKAKESSSFNEFTRLSLLDAKKRWRVGSLCCLRPRREQTSSSLTVHGSTQAKHFCSNKKEQASDHRDRQPVIYPRLGPLLKIQRTRFQGPWSLSTVQSSTTSFAVITPLRRKGVGSLCTTSIPIGTGERRSNHHRRSLPSLGVLTRFVGGRGFIFRKNIHTELSVLQRDLTWGSFYLPFWGNGFPYRER